jgi:hypothetical protein
VRPLAASREAAIAARHHAAFANHDGRRSRRNAALVFVVGRTPWGEGLPLRVIVRLTKPFLSRRGMHDKLRVDYGPFMARGIAAKRAVLRAAGAAAKARGAIAKRFPSITCSTGGYYRPPASYTCSRVQ